MTRLVLSVLVPALALLPLSAGPANAATSPNCIADARAALATTGPQAQHDAITCLLDRVQEDEARLDAVDAHFKKTLPFVGFYNPKTGVMSLTPPVKGGTVNAPASAEHATPHAD